MRQRDPRLLQVPARPTATPTKEEIGVETLSGRRSRPRWAGDDLVTVDMGRPVLAPAKIPTTLGSGEGPVLDVSSLDVLPLEKGRRA